MPDDRIDRLADVIIDYSTRTRRGDLVTIVTDLETAAARRAVEAIYAAAIRAGAHPSVHVRSERLQRVLLTHGHDTQITHISPFERHRLEHCDVLIVLDCGAPRHKFRPDAAKMALMQGARRELTAMSIHRAARGELRYCLVAIPTTAAARDAGMSLREYENFVYDACFFNTPDPVAAWRELHEQQQRLCDYLATKRELRFVVPGVDGNEGTDLSVDITGRMWLNAAGAENMPDGEVYTSPVSADGVVNFTFPAEYKGVSVEGIRLKFAAGRVVEASARRNEDHLIKMLDMDAGARVMGEVALGTNYNIRRFIGNTIFDEKIGGTFHVAVGAAFPECGGVNESGLHWDMVSDSRSGGMFHADGELFQRDGVYSKQGWPRKE